MPLKLQQVFVGCPFQKSVRKHYDKLKKELEGELPIHLILADTTAISSTDYLLEHITTLIRESAACVFDATGGNPNVSLEVGIAHAIPTDFLICLYTRRPRGNRSAADTIPPSALRPIISDLQGRNRIEYKTFATLKSQVNARFMSNLPYIKRWHEFKTRHSTWVPFAIKVFHELRSSGRTLRPRVIALLDGSGIDADDLLSALSAAKLLVVRTGRHGGVYYPIK